MLYVLSFGVSLLTFDTPDEVSYEHYSAFGDINIGVITDLRDDWLFHYSANTTNIK